jgi:hypothetical protein
MTCVVALLHYFVLFILIGVLFLIICTCLLVCMCVLDRRYAFEGPQEPKFEEVPEQQQFANEVKWSLIMLQSH